MSQGQLTNRRVQVYLFLTQSFRGFIGFSLALLGIVATVSVWELLAGSGMTHPILDREFSWGVFLREFLPLLAGFSLLYGGVSMWSKLHALHLNVQTDGVVVDSGLVMKSRDFIPFSNVKKVQILQSPLGRLLNFARLNIDYGGWYGETIEFVSMENARKIQRKISNSIDVNNLDGKAA